MRIYTLPQLDLYDAVCASNVHSHQPEKHVFAM